MKGVDVGKTRKPENLISVNDFLTDALAIVKKVFRAKKEKNNSKKKGVMNLFVTRKVTKTFKRDSTLSKKSRKCMRKSKNRGKPKTKENQAKHKLSFKNIEKTLRKATTKDKSLKAVEPTIEKRKESKTKRLMRKLALNLLTTITLTSNTGAHVFAANLNSSIRNTAYVQTISTKATDAKVENPTKEINIQHNYKKYDYDACLNIGKDSKGNKVDNDAQKYGSDSAVYKRLSQINNEYNNTLKTYNKNYADKEIQKLQERDYSNGSPASYNSDAEQLQKQLQTTKANADKTRVVADVENKLNSLEFLGSDNKKLIVDGVINTNTEHALNDFCKAYTLATNLGFDATAKKVMEAQPIPKPKVVTKTTAKASKSTKTTNIKSSNISKNLNAYKIVKKVTLNASAYTASADECGNDKGITASGAKVQEWHTVAAGSAYPAGTVLYIPYFKNCPNGGIFVVQDTGSAITNKHIDIYMRTKYQANQFGRRDIEVYVLSRN